MNVYRNSILHNAKNGAFLAKCLAIFLSFKKDKHTIYEKDEVFFDLDLSEVIDSSLYYSGTFEPKMELIINKYLKPGMQAIDIGANIGYHTFRMAKLVKPTGWVFAIEPTTWAFERLIHNASLNSELTNIKFIKVGLAENDLGGTKINFQSSYQLNGKKEKNEELIELKKLDTLASELKLTHLDFIKLDVDGYESKIIKGGINVLQKFKPKLLFEFTPSEIINMGDQPSILIGLLQSIGYQLFDENQKEIKEFNVFYENYPPGFSIMILALPKTKETKETL
jgi:FkbM family methyltransferase